MPKLLNHTIHTIHSKPAFFRLDWRELWRYRDLVYYFIKREFVAYYKQTILGPLWYIIQPLSSSIVLWVVFTKIAKVSTGDIPPILFYLSGNIIWMYFSENLTKVSDTFIGNSNIFGKVYFPRLTVPISIILSGLIGLFIQILLLFCFYLYFVIIGEQKFGSFRLLWIPLSFMGMMITTLSFGLLISSLTTKYRDLRFVLRFGIQLWMFASPVAYSSNIIPEKYLNLYYLNPITPIIESFRYALFGYTNMELHHILIYLVTTFTFLLISVLLFNKVEKSFMDTV